MTDQERFEQRVKNWNDRLAQQVKAKLEKSSRVMIHFDDYAGSNIDIENALDANGMDYAQIGNGAYWVVNK